MLTGNDRVHTVAASYSDDNPAVLVPTDGLTIRQFFAAMAMQGMLSACQGYDNRGSENLAKCAVQQADALIKALNNE